MAIIVVYFIIFMLIIANFTIRKGPFILKIFGHYYLIQFNRLRAEHIIETSFGKMLIDFHKNGETYEYMIKQSSVTLTVKKIFVHFGQILFTKQATEKKDLLLRSLIEKSFEHIIPFLTIKT